jgi:phage terminase small subunit
VPARLTAKQEAFALQYTIDHNATKAAIRAGYSENGARQAGHRLLTSADVRQRIAELEREANAETKTKVRLSRQRLLERLLEISETAKSESTRNWRSCAREWQSFKNWHAGAGCGWCSVFDGNRTPSGPDEPFLQRLS